MAAPHSSVVYVVDDDDQVRVALDSLFRSSGLHVEAFASTSEFLSFPRQSKPSCLILDVRLRGESGLNFQQQAATCGIKMPILFITGHGDIEMSVRAMKAGAQEFFTKPYREQDVLDAVMQALARDARRLAAEHANAQLRACYDSLTPREREVFGFVVGGLMNKQIAAEMNLSEIMVKVHRGRVMKKMHAGTVADLVRKSEELGGASNVSRSPA
jgi:FixJ family two-component response regulator